MKSQSDADAIQRYLTKYSTGQHAVELADEACVYDTIVVIPAIDEYENIKRLLTSLSKNNPADLQSTLFIFVINNAISSNEQIKEENAKTISFLRDIIHNNVHDVFANQISSSKVHIGIIDLSSPGMELPDKTAGVGLARKIGMDEALKLFPTDCAHPVLVCLDADCTVSENYLSAIRETAKTNSVDAAALQYEHPFDNLDTEELKAIVCYELFLRYYTLGLIYAGSPYSFHTIGSTIVCSVNAYMKAEGMNKKKAGEDFYFLEKVAKMFPVYTINEARVFPSARGSWRVPFGTGQRIDRYMRKEQDEYQLYNPKSFTILKNWLSYFICSSLNSPKDYLREAKKIDGSLYNFLIENDFEADWQRIFAGPQHQFPLQKKIWFDGFRTLKFIHYLRDNGYPNVPMFEAIDALALLIDEPISINRDNLIPDIDVQIQYLQWCREISTTTK